MSAVMQPRPSQPPYGAAAMIHRKPIPKPGIAVRPPSQQYDSYQPPPPGHSRTRTTSSGIFPINTAVSLANAYAAPVPAMQSSQYPAGYPAQYPPQQFGQGTRRTLSNATSSTSSTTGTPNRSNSGALRRSSSSRSGNSPSSYVALMRKQKATVWCDRAQYEDPRILAAQRAAKMRANMEVAGGPHHGARLTSSGSSVAAGVRSKITHRAPKASLYAPQNMAGTGVPMRLSASEVDEGDSDQCSSGGGYHQRSGSGRSSLGSGRRVGYAGAGRHSSNSTPPNGNNVQDGGMADVLEEETPVGAYTDSNTYFEHTKTGLSNQSGSSGERNFGDVGQMPQRFESAQNKGADDLHRRASVLSVDERTMTMGNTRLFIANPDVDD